MFKKIVVPCPFCSKDIEILFEEQSYTAQSSHAAGRTKTQYSFKPERSQAISACPHCGKSKNEIQKALTGGVSKSKSKEDLKKQLEELGLTGKL